ncbi:hypothetical protein ACCO45_006755 [Purpureocillium lilacinum]|uniref:Uncharacterized protein n=1 Tax=Purpureocillium lilacinum TaxID=33203 RepID=A0ACC4DRF8_PURLI
MPPRGPGWAALSERPGAGRAAGGAAGGLRRGQRTRLEREVLAFPGRGAGGGDGGVAEVVRIVSVPCYRFPFRFRRTSRPSATHAVITTPRRQRQARHLRKIQPSPVQQVHRVHMRRRKRLQEPRARKHRRPLRRQRLPLVSALQRRHLAQQPKHIPGTQHDRAVVPAAQRPDVVRRHRVRQARQRQDTRAERVLRGEGPQRGEEAVVGADADGARDAVCGGGHAEAYAFAAACATVAVVVAVGLPAVAQREALGDGPAEQGRERVGRAHEGDMRGAFEGVSPYHIMAEWPHTA